MSKRTPLRKNARSEKRGQPVPQNSPNGLKEMKNDIAIVRDTLPAKEHKIPKEHDEHQADMEEAEGVGNAVPASDESEGSSAPASSELTELKKLKNMPPASESSMKSSPRKPPPPNEHGDKAKACAEQQENTTLIPAVILLSLFFTGLSFFLWVLILFS